jgi:N-acyl-D-aspartate/D-glutamate deacylase
MNKAPFDTLLDLAISEKLRTLLSPAVLSDDAESWRMRAAAWTDSRVVIGGSDAGAHLDMIDTFAFSSQLLGECVRDRQLISLESAVHQMTEIPARAFGLSGRGLLKEGRWADLVIFDPERIGCGPLHSRGDLPAGCARLYVEALGINHVIVNGTVIVSENRFLGRFPGTVFRSGRDTYTASMA